MKKKRVGDINAGVSHNIRKNHKLSDATHKLKKKLVSHQRLNYSKVNLLSAPQKVFRIKTKGKGYTYSIHWGGSKIVIPHCDVTRKADGNGEGKVVSAMQNHIMNRAPDESMTRVVHASEEAKPPVIECTNPPKDECGRKPFFPIFYPRNSMTSCNRNDALKVSKLKKCSWSGDTQQTMIDLGQRNVGAKVCDECGMVFAQEADVDKFEHQMFHLEKEKKLSIGEWKKINQFEFGDSKILIVNPSDSKHCWNKVYDVLSVVDSELGFSGVGLRNPQSSKVYMYVERRKIVGVLVAEAIDCGYPLVYDENCKVSMCSDMPRKALCGISRIWTNYGHRRKGVAVRLLECLRATFIYGSCIPREQLSFSHPTPDGILLATHYCGTKSFLVYPT